ncbi:hypothetical protein [Bradyrhizobium sp. CCGE-LA001]|uniref:hypothetical protein n=1 Tax=Bradyrhizobium sp. CCGE-LA001 TaxID=1223566 RepID=UPI0002AA9711|nr:hypothetical protein [Bradyrhizobium sp. CCGE-LA001]AMA60078.1 hypothetical protein BCCGELA001_30140 [Bradyrhizobium sp. CCGE-LA001]
MPTALDLVATVIMINGHMPAPSAIAVGLIRGGKAHGRDLRLERTSHGPRGPSDERLSSGAADGIKDAELTWLGPGEFDAPSRGNFNLARINAPREPAVNENAFRSAITVVPSAACEAIDRLDQQVAIVLDMLIEQHKTRLRAVDPEHTDVFPAQATMVPLARSRVQVILELAQGASGSAPWRRPPPPFSAPARLLSTKHSRVCEVSLRVSSPPQ